MGAGAAEMVQDGGSVCYRRCAQHHPARLGEHTALVVTTLVLVRVFINSPISNLTELNLNEQIHPEWVLLLLPFFSPPGH